MVGFGACHRLRHGGEETSSAALVHLRGAAAVAGTTLAEISSAQSATFLGQLLILIVHNDRASPDGAFMIKAQIELNESCLEISLQQASERAALLPMRRVMTRRSR